MHAPAKEAGKWVTKNVQQQQNITTPTTTTKSTVICCIYKKIYEWLN